MTSGRLVLLLALTAASACEFRVDSVALVDAPNDAGAADDAAMPSDLTPEPPDDLSPPPPDLSMPPILTGMRQAVPPMVDLSGEGKLDWIHFGLVVPSDVNRKATGGQQINMTASANFGQYGNYMPAYSWNDGTPTMNANTHAGVYLNGTGNGFTLTVPASATTRTVHVYVTSFSAHATFTAHLSDGAVGDYVDTMITGGGNVFADYVVTFRDGTPGAQLTLTWILSAPSTPNGYSSVDLMAATLH